MELKFEPTTAVKAHPLYYVCHSPRAGLGPNSMKCFSLSLFPHFIAKTETDSSVPRILGFLEGRATNTGWYVVCQALLLCLQAVKTLQVS